MYFFFQAEDGIRDLVRSRGLGDVYKRQNLIVDFLERPESLGDGFRVEAKIVVWESGSVLKLSLIHI